MRERIRGDVAGLFPQPFYSGYGQPGYPFHGAPVGLGELGFGEGKFASELSRLQYQAPAERGLSTACEESEKLLERYRRERHIFTPMESEIRARANGKSATLEPIKSVATKVSEEANWRSDCLCALTTPMWRVFTHTLTMLLDIECQRWH